MKKTALSLSCAALLAGASTAGFASDWTLSGNVALTSDYVFRGFTQTDADPAIQGGFDLNHSSGFFIGTWASNVESDPAAPINYDGSSMELDIYAGWSGPLGEMGPDLTVKALRFIYPGTNTSTNDTNEFSLYLSKDLGPAAVTAGINYSDDFYGAGDALYWDAGIDIPIQKATLSLHVGASDFDAGGDYVDYSVGVSGDVAGLGLALTYTGVDDVAGCTARTCDNRVAFSVSKSF